MIVSTVIFGILQGNITWQYNKFVGTKPDIDAVVVLIPVDLPDESIAHISALVFINFPIECHSTRVDGMGQYYFSSIPEGDYIIMVRSANTNDNPDWAEFNVSRVLKYYKKDAKENLILDSKLHSIDCTSITIYGNQTNIYSYDFGYTYISFNN